MRVKGIFGGENQMKKLMPVIFLLFVSVIISSCVRPASGPSTSLPTKNATQSAPVSTQSQLMKEIIAGTQTAMANAYNIGTPQPTGIAGTSVPGATVGAGAATPFYSSPTPVFSSPTPNATAIPAHPTLTPGPPPIVPATYISGSAGNAVPEFIITKVEQDWTVTIQTATYYPANNNFTVRIGPYGTNGVDGVIVGFTNSGQGGIFSATYNIPDSLHGSDKLAIRMDGENGFFSFNWFYDTSTP